MHIASIRSILRHPIRSFRIIDTLRQFSLVPQQAEQSWLDAAARQWHDSHHRFWVLPSAMGFVHDQDILRRCMDCSARPALLMDNIQLLAHAETTRAAASGGVVGWHRLSCHTHRSNVSEHLLVWQDDSDDAETLCRTWWQKKGEVNHAHGADSTATSSTYSASSIDYS